MYHRARRLLSQLLHDDVERRARGTAEAGGQQGIEELNAANERSLADAERVQGDAVRMKQPCHIIVRRGG